jgi:hypothetical protein
VVRLATTDLSSRRKEYFGTRNSKEHLFCGLENASSFLVVGVTNSVEQYPC